MKFESASLLAIDLLHSFMMSDPTSPCYARESCLSLDAYRMPMTRWLK
jgi:hypothetical protein